MNVRDALEKGCTFAYPQYARTVLDNIAPKVEAALRAAYNIGFDEGSAYTTFRESDVGVTAGIKELSK